MHRREAVALLMKTQRVERARRAAKQNVGRQEFNLLICDPPWPVRYDKWDAPYRPMSLDSIIDLHLGPNGRATKVTSDPSVAQAMAPCAAIGLWAIEDTIDFAKNTLLPAWGFEHLRPTIIWHKLGQTRPRPSGCAFPAHEYFLVGARGGAAPVWFPRSVVTVDRTGLAHSEKPGDFHDMLRKMFPLLVNRLELFARARRDGWRGWGDEYPAHD
jgi:N6-adenosine-specific RNA methylase IME4